MKGDYAYGEYETLSKLSNIEVSKFGFRSLIDPSNIKPEDLEDIITNLNDLSVEVEGKEKVRIFCE